MSMDSTFSGSKPRFGRGAVTAYGFCTSMTFPASSSAPTPLYHLYQEVLHLRPFDVTIIFACYAFSLLAALLTVGGLSDYVGRKPVILAALLLNAGAMLLFAFADSLGLLIAARLVQGLAAGIAIPTLGAAIMDSDPSRGSLFNSIAPFIGLFAGSLLAGLLVTFAPAPLHLVYAVLLVVTLVEIVLLARMPETTQSKPGALASLKPAVRIPAKALAAVLMTTPVNVAGWALAGFYLSLMPSLVSVATGIRSPLIGASVVSMLMLVASLSVMTLRGLAASRIMVIGTLSLMIGVAVTLTGIHLQNVVLLFAGTAVVGIGFGANFSAILRIVLPLADADDRAALLSAFFVESYLAFSLPAIVAGLTAPYLGLAGTSYAYGGGVLLLAAISLVATRRLPIHR